MELRSRVVPDCFLQSATIIQVLPNPKVYGEIILHPPGHDLKLGLTILTTSEHGFLNHLWGTRSWSDIADPAVVAVHRIVNLARPLTVDHVPVRVLDIMKAGPQRSHDHSDGAIRDPELVPRDVDIIFRANN